SCDVSGHRGDKNAEKEEQVLRKKIPGSADSNFSISGVGPQRFNQRKEKEDAVGKVDVDHQTGNEPEEHPLCGATGWPRAFPIPKKQGNHKSGMRMRPCGIEIHVNRKRTPEPHAQSRQKSPFFSNVLPGRRERRGAPGEEKETRELPGLR